MKKILQTILSVILLSSTCSAQQFSFQMYFVDAIGNKDTITLGYDLNATDSIDAAFGEVNIISTPLDTNLDVRITNTWWDSSSPISFHTKKQIIYNYCNSFSIGIQPINIFTHHWPVTATWDNTLFNDSCRYGSVFTSINPGGWWDTGAPSDLWRKDLFFGSSATFTTNFEEGYYGYINSSGDSIPVFWQAFADSTFLTASIPTVPNKSQKLLVYPNPTENKINLVTPKDFGTIKSIEIYSAIGKLISNSTNISSLDIAFLESGIYFIAVSNNKNERLTSVFVKK